MNIKKTKTNSLSAKSDLGCPEKRIKNEKEAEKDKFTRRRQEDHELGMQEGNLERKIQAFTREISILKDQMTVEIKQRSQSEKAQTELLKFEQLLLNLSLRFVNIPPDQVDAEIHNAMLEILNLFKVDRLALIETFPDKNSWIITHSVSPDGMPSVPVGVVLQRSLHPWAYEKLIMKREVMSFTKLDDVPAEANADKKTWIEWGIKSNLTIPIMIGETVDHVIAINSIRRERVWPKEFIFRMRLLGGIFVNALERKRISLQIEEQLRFEGLISNLSSNFVNLPFDKVDNTIQTWLHALAEFFRADRCTIGLFSDDKTELVSAFDYHVPETEPPPASIAKEQMPWYIGRLMVGEALIMNRVGDLPLEAENERRLCLSKGIKSILSIPLIGGGRTLGSLALVSTIAENIWSQQLVPRIQLVGEIFINALESRKTSMEIEERIGFERLLSEISVHFVNLRADQVDNQIEDAQRRVCEYLGLDLSVLWQWSMETPRILTLTHLSRPLEEQPPEPMYASEYFPWCQQQLEAGKMVIVSSMDDLPPEAAVDKEVWQHFGIKTSLTFPLSSGGNTPIGALSFNTMMAERTWPEAIVNRLQIVAQIFAHTLARKQFETALHESEARLNLATESVGAGLWIMDVNTKKVWVSPKSRELFHFGTDEEIHYESYFKKIHPEDQDRVNQEVQHALQSGEDLRCDYRITLPDGSIRWITARGKPYVKSTGEPSRILGLSMDITDRKQMEIQLGESRAELSAVIDSTSDMIWSVDAERFGLLTFNRVLSEYFLHERGIHIKRGDRPEDLFPTEEFIQKWKMFYRKAVGKGSFTTEYMVYAGTRVLQLNINRIEQDGTVFGLSVFGQDITERKRMENEIREQLAEISTLKLQLEKENVYLREEIKTELGFGNIIGGSSALQYVLFRAQQVAPTDATVLILGETGTGKGMVAHAIHEMSPRKNKAMVSINCAALPENLIESELFGREKGAFTGAHVRQIGRFEVADGGTIFLDEIGEMPLAVQAKLLGVLQDGQFERLGSVKTIKVDVRVIAATSRNLKDDARNGRFREDLYYRLNVFPVSIPPLRSRSEDIPELVHYFIDKYARKSGRKIETVSKNIMQILKTYSWPGNVRELEHVIETAVITSVGSVLQLTDRLDFQKADKPEESLKDLETIEREHILKVLQKTRWKVDGEGSASTILGLNPSTLRFRIKKLGITRP